MDSIPDLENIKQKSRFIEPLPFIGAKTATTIYPNIYLPRKTYTDLRSENPDPYVIGLILHEQEHIKRIQATNTLSWYMKYVFNKRFRFEEELAASQPQLAFIKSKNLQFNLERKARSLSGWLYLWSTNYNDALQRLQTMWNTID